MIRPLAGDGGSQLRALVTKPGFSAWPMQFRVPTDSHSLQLIDQLLPANGRNQVGVPHIVVPMLSPTGGQMQFI